MHDLESISVVLRDFLSKEDVIYLRCEPEILDFRQRYAGVIILSNKYQSVEFPVIYSRINSFAGLLARCVFDSRNIVLVWDIKRLMSLLRFHLGRDYRLSCPAKVFDLKLLEAFSGIDHKEQPTSWGEAFRRLHGALENKYVRNIHEKIHLPLAMRVIPGIETLGVGKIGAGKIHSFYHIEGQLQGRLRCAKEFNKCYLAHHMSEQEKTALRTEHESRFVMIDYRYMEVSVLQWLSGDEKLGKIIKSGKDLYTVTYQLLSGKPCDNEKRKLIKDSLLSVFYGSGADRLSRALSETKQDTQWLIDQIHHHFSGAMAWLQDQQKRAEKGTYEDYFGRRRKCSEAYLARSAAVQGPAAVVCLEKLIHLYDHLAGHANIVASVHDGYLLSIREAGLQDTIQAAVALLESPSEMCPGLQLKVNYKVWKN